MKRSEFIQLLRDNLNNNLFLEKVMFSEDWATQIVDTVEELGMFPPLANEGQLDWEPEDEA